MHGNGYDAEAADNEIRNEVREVDDRVTRVDRRVSDVAAAGRTTVDRLAPLLGRASELEQDVRDIKRLVAAMAAKMGVAA